MPEETQPTTPVASTQAPATPSAGTPNTETPAAEPTVPYARFKEINDKLKALEDEQTSQAKTRQADDEKKLAEQAEWQKLYEGGKTKIAELTPKAELADKLSDLVTAQYAAEIKEWPEQVRNMAPGDDASILTKLEWANKARALATELLKDKTPVPGNGGRPKVASAAGVAKQDDKQRESWTVQANRRYR